MQRKHLILMVALLASSQAWAINKCMGADGKVSYQEQPCQGQGAELKIRQQGSPIAAPTTEKKPVAPSEVPVRAAAVAPSAQPVRAQKSELETQADQCLAYYKPKLRDPSGAYHSEAAMDGSVLSIKMHATNGFGGYVTRQVKCEFKQNGDLDADWTKIHAQRIGW